MNRIDAFFTAQADSWLVIDSLNSLGWLDDVKTILEPAVGSGSLVKLLIGKFDIVAYDIKYYGFQDTIVEDFLQVQPQRVDLVIGNPPFGRNATLATKFFNLCCQWSDRIAFIVPKSFRKSSIMDRLNPDFWPILDEDLTSGLFFDFDNDTNRFIPCCLQLWERKNYARKKTDKVINYNDYFTTLTKEQALETNGSFAFRGQGASAGRILEGLDHFPSSTRFLLGNKELISQIDFTELSRQTAATPALGYSEIALGLMLHKDFPELLETYLTYGIVKLIADNEEIKNLFKKG